VRTIALLLLFSPTLAWSQAATWTEAAGGLNDQGKFEDAQKAAENALANNPQDDFAMLELAISRTSQAMKLNPHSGDAYAVRAAAYWEMGFNDLAIKDLRAAALRDARFVPVLRNIGGTVAVPKGLKFSQMRFAALRGNIFVLGGVLLALLGLLLGLLAVIPRKPQVSAA
jgi:tetratricopeptide (TPR) repeat protein